MPSKNKTSALSAAESKIRKALIITAAVVVLAATLFGLIYWFQSHTVEKEVVVQQARVAPVTTPAAMPDAVPTLPFSDITEAAGIDFEHINGAYGERLMPETIGSGLAFFDYDGDGDQDLFLVNGHYWPGHEGDKPTHHALYANDGTGHFTDVTQQAGLDFTDYGMGVAIGDYDADGQIDLFLSNLGANRLLHNEGGHFTDVTAIAGVAGAPTDWSSSSAFIDYDNDGDLDLFVLHYVKWSRQDDLDIDFKLTGLGRAYGAPNHFIGTHNTLYRNEGDGRFTDVSHAAGIRIENDVAIPVGKGLGVTPLDYDRDGWIDLAIANDTVSNFLFHNLGNGRFEEVGAFEGLAFDRNGKATGAMGIDSAYFRNDPDLGVAIGNFANEMTSLFVTVDGQPPFADEAMLEGLGPDSRLALTFGLFFFDADLDGWLDLLQVNGHLEHEINKVQPSQHYEQPPQLFWNGGDKTSGRFQLVAGVGDLSQPMVGRGVAYADIDGDGDLDLAVLQNGRKARLFRNDQQSGHHWLRLKLMGKGHNRDAIGARIVLSSHGVSQERLVMPTRGFMSQMELPVTFGLGEATTVERVSITWPDGSQQDVPVSQVDRLLTVQQP